MEAVALLSAACKLRGELAAVLGEAATAGHEGRLEAAANALDRLTACVDSAGLKWLQGLVSCGIGDIEKEASEVLSQPTPAHASCMDTLIMSKDLPSFLNDDMGTPSLLWRRSWPPM